jgi:hypothetical protein
MGTNRFVTPSGRVFMVSEGETDIVVDLARNERGFEIGFIIFAIIVRRAKDVIGLKYVKKLNVSAVVLLQLEVLCRKRYVFFITFLLCSAELCRRT